MSRKLIAQLGDVNPFDYGGYFIFQEENGEYEAELVEVDEGSDDETESWIIRRFILDRCTYIDGVLSDNKFHPESPAWFAKTETQRLERPQDTTYLQDVAKFAGWEVDDLIAAFCSENPTERAFAWKSVGDYHGFENLDDYPLTITSREEIEQRYLGWKAHLEQGI